MRDRDSKLIYEGWRGIFSKDWDQNHSAQERGFNDYDHEQQHRSDVEAAEKLGVSLDDYNSAKEKAEQEGKTVEEVIAARKAELDRLTAPPSPEEERRRSEAIHNRRVQDGYYKRNGLVPYQDENGIWKYRSKDHRDTGNYRDNPKDLRGRYWD